MEGEQTKTRYQQVIDGDVEPIGSEKGWLNLKRYDLLSDEEKRELHVQGGKTRAQEKRDRKTLKDDLLKVLKSTELTKRLARESNSDVLIELAQDKNVTVQDLVTVSALIQIVQGSPKMFELVRDTIGEKPKDDIQINADIVTSADRKLIENLRNRLGVVQNDEESEEQ